MNGQPFLSWAPLCAVMGLCTGGALVAVYRRDAPMVMFYLCLAAFMLQVEHAHRVAKERGEDR